MEIRNAKVLEILDGGGARVRIDGPVSSIYADIMPAKDPFVKVLTRNIQGEPICAVGAVVDGILLLQTEGMPVCNDEGEPIPSSAWWNFATGRAAGYRGPIGGWILGEKSDTEKAFDTLDEVGAEESHYFAIVDGQNWRVDYARQSKKVTRLQSEGFKRVTKDEGELLVCFLSLKHAKVLAEREGLQVRPGMAPLLEEGRKAARELVAFLDAIEVVEDDAGG